MSPRRIDIKHQWFLTVDQGRRLELIQDGDEPGVPYPVATLFADETDESLHIEIYTESGPIQIPADQLLKALDAAKAEVRSERWFETHVYPTTESDPNDPPE